LRDDGEFVLRRTGMKGLPTLMLAPASDQPALESLQRLEHEYLLRNALDPSWAVRPRALTREHGRPTLLLDDPVGAVVRWSHDPSLTACEPTADGAAFTAVELQLRHLEVAQRFAAAGGFDGIVPRADEILALWEDTLRKLRVGDTPALAGRLDWVLKRQILEQALAAHPHLDWESPEIKYLDHAYSSLDPARGLYWAHERLGTVEQLVPAARIAHFEEEPPDDTRAWTRAMLLRRAGPDAVQDMDWDFLRIAVGGGYLGLESRTLLLEDPFGPPRTTVEAALAWATSLDELLAAIGALPRTPHAHTTCYPVARI